MKKVMTLVLALVMVCVLGACGSKEFAWPEDSIANVLPHPETNKIDISFDDEDSFYATVEKYSPEDYKTYIKKCEETGFTIDREKDDISFDAYNNDGYKLSLLYFESEKSLSIDLDAPIRVGKIKWPTSDMVKLLPIPKSDVGKINWEHSDDFAVYVGEISLDEYNAYVDECAQKGFTEDYEKGDKYYRAYNVDGIYLSLKYEGNNIMYIDIKESERNKETDNNTDNNTDNQNNNTSLPENQDDQNDKSSDSVNPDLKAFLDEYEAFMDEYIAFMKKYSESDNVLDMLSDYTEIMKRYTEYADAVSKYNSNEMSAVDAAYYLEVTTRVAQKLLEVAN